ncbi:MAG: CPA1 family monovalent cation:H+ antiporter [Crocinitomix sp.]|jgi:CPA1 family monovalent cation:H+ antiporter
MFEAFSILLLIVAIFSLINVKFIKLPNSIALMILGIVMAILLSFAKYISEDFYNFFCNLIVDADLKNLLFNSLLSFLLFAGSMHVDYGLLMKEKKFIISFSTVSVLISTFVVGVFLYYASQLVGLPIGFIESLLFGALISPTDPVAALTILKKSGVSQKIKMKIEGESLFNDGIGVIVFSGLLLWLSAQTSMNEEGFTQELIMLFVEEVIGGLAFGALLGFVGYYLIKSCAENQGLQVILSLAIAASGYSLAMMMHLSGPLAMVVAGLIVGNKMHLNDAKIKANVFYNRFWEVLDEVLNGVLFLMIGLSLHLIPIKSGFLLLGIIMIILVLISRYISILLPLTFFKGKLDKGTKTILTWAGLRGGISLALAMSLPETEVKDLIMLITFMIVAFSIIVQGLTIGKVVKRLNKK